MESQKAPTSPWPGSPCNGASDRDRGEGAEPSLLTRYAAVRAGTLTLTAPLAVEDHVVQSMPDVSPTSWHLAHTTWFFENFVLRAHAEGQRGAAWRPHAAMFDHLFNSYYETVGKPFARPRRGTLSRPTVQQILTYRQVVDEQMQHLLAEPEALGELAAVAELGLHHEQQHQELILTDIAHVFWSNPLRPAYRQRRDTPPSAGDARTDRVRWLDVPDGVHEIGHDGIGFAFDNEGPRHRVWLPGGLIADRLVTNGEYLEFMRDGGYRRPELWLADGWQAVQSQSWAAPLYWVAQGEEWQEFTLGGMCALQPAEPLSHVSYYEADAFARWASCRLPLEAEWEVVARSRPVTGNFVESGRLHPQPAAGDDGASDERADVPRLRQAYGDVWEWTASSYGPYPGYRAVAGALGEYNGKFMCSQMVLRGGSCVTPADHVRSTYRNFFPPDARWQFSGLRLAR